MTYILSLTLSFILAHSSNPYLLNKWACDKVNAQSAPDAGGCYDFCEEHEGNGWFDLSHDLQNACAVVSHGGEY